MVFVLLLVTVDVVVVVFVMFESSASSKLLTEATDTNITKRSRKVFFIVHFLYSPLALIYTRLGTYSQQIFVLQVLLCNNLDVPDGPFAHGFGELKVGKVT